MIFSMILSFKPHFTKYGCDHLLKHMKKLKIEHLCLLIKGYSMNYKCVCPYI